MPKTIKEERLRWILPIYNKDIRMTDAVKVCQYSQRSLERWLAEYNNLEHCGLNGKTPNEMLELLLNEKPTNVCG